MRSVQESLPPTSPLANLLVFVGIPSPLSSAVVLKTLIRRSAEPSSSTVVRSKPFLARVPHKLPRYWRDRPSILGAACSRRDCFETAIALALIKDARLALCGLFSGVIE